MNYLELLKLASPEAVVTVTALIVLAIGLMSTRGAGVCSGVAVAGLVFAVAAVLELPERATLFHGMLVITPLTFLGGSFYSISVLPPVWQTITLFNPVVYLVSGFRWSFYGIADVSVGVSLGMTLVFLAACLTTVWWIFKTGYRLKK